MALLMGRGQRPSFAWKPTQFEQGQSVTLPAPYGGLNLRGDITALAQNEARVLDNWVASSGQLALRPGYVAWATGMGSGEVKTLAAFNGLTTQRMLAGANGKIWDATADGSATQLATGFTGDLWVTECYNNRLILVNGLDAPQAYDGSTVGAAGFTGSGLTAANLAYVACVQNRMWFAEKNSADVWYGGVGAITGALTKFQLSQIASGGKCAAIASWSRDSGNGPNDYTVFVMTTGEIIVYAGDPSTTFSIVGKYRGAPPLMTRPLFKVGGEVIVITSLGLLPVSAAIGGVNLDLARIDPWGKIAPGVVTDAGLYGGNAGWHGELHQGYVYVQVPQTAGSLSKLYVLNTRVGSWATFSGWNSSALCSFDGGLYFGSQSGGLVYKVAGSSDNGADITATANGAFIYPAGPTRGCMYTAIRPRFEAQGSVSGIVGVDTDFTIRPILGSAVNIVDDPSTTPWGSPWGSPWGVSGQAQPQWLTIIGSGRSVSVKIKAVGKSPNLKWYASDVLWKPGSIR